MERKIDYKKEYKDLYCPNTRPQEITVPPIDFIAIEGSGDPNSDRFQKAVALLYGISYTIKMSKMKGNQPEGYFEYVVPPLEGLWWIEGGRFDFNKRDNWRWDLLIRQPEFVTRKVFDAACEAYRNKEKGADLSGLRFVKFDEGLCVQILHVGPYATEPESVAKMEAYMEERGLVDRLGEGGKHHEIYMSDPRKGKPEAMKTVIRHPVRKR